MSQPMIAWLTCAEGSWRENRNGADKLEQQDEGWR
jgi:hypothetical protein